MVYPHHQKAIAYITDKFLSDDQAEALLISGSIMHGFNDEYADVDLNIVVSDAVFRQKMKERAAFYWESAEDFYPGGYFDGKYISLGYLSEVAEHGNEPTRFALRDCRIAFDKTGRVAGYLRDIGRYPTDRVLENTLRFLSQLEAWKWYCDEALKKKDPYLLDLSVTKLILFAGRLILLENRMFFPYHKWFMRVLEEAPRKPGDFMPAVRELLRDKSRDNVSKLYDLIKNYKDWSGGDQNWPSYFTYDIETVWMRQDEFVENI